MNLLLVDDEVITIQGIRKGVCWEQLPFEEVFSASSAQEAREIIKIQQVDIMLCDIEMPEEDGLELLQWVRDQKYDVECIFLTCHEKFDFARKAIELNGMDYLLKPIPYAELQERLHKACERIIRKKVSSKYEEYGKASMKRMENRAFDEMDSRKSGEEIVADIKQYIQCHLEEDLSAELLAKTVHVSLDYLYHLFKKTTGRTLGDYITEARMFYASGLLKNSDISISRVAISVGYNNYCYFTKVFKKVYGMTPSQYQAKYKRVTD